VIVDDASLAVKWVLWEADTLAALDLLARHGPELCAPDTLLVEVGAVIVRYANDGKSRHPDIAGDALEALRKWTDAWARQAVRPYPVNARRLHEAGKLAILLGHPIKDCIYLALAIELGCELATCDRRFRDRARELHPGIRLLPEYSVTASPGAEPGEA